MKLSAIFLLPLLHGAVSATNAVSSECTETHTLPVITTDLVPGATLEPYAPGYDPHPDNTNSNDAGPPKSSALPPIIPGGSRSGSSYGPGPGSAPGGSAPSGSAPGSGSGSGSGSGAGASHAGSAPGSNTTPIPSDHPQYASAASNPSANIVGISAFVAGSIALVLTNF
ncbi:hypothetical protein FANTH_12787 [Fusarium anthophilum]|uniref:Uncharacterized protein n=1 Tax=Fusarium anthophilum TaxID=48485 RepID=A0A8H4YRF1_9HYPO|nr:hypothetical protein FANTH_12787 [Fusarium anthophilum]